MACIDNCKIIDIPKISSDKGSLSVAESNLSIPFNIKRVYFTYDIPVITSYSIHYTKLYEFPLSYSLISLPRNLYQGRFLK